MLTDIQLAALRHELTTDPAGIGYAGKKAEQISELLHDPRPYTVTTEQPAPLTLVAVMGALAGSMANLLALPCFMDMRDKVIAQDRTAVGLYAQVLTLGQKITPEEAAAVGQLLVATETVETVQHHEPRILFAFTGVEGMPNRIELADIAAALES